MIAIQQTIGVQSSAMSDHQYLIKPALAQISNEGVPVSPLQIKLGRWFVSFRSHALPYSSISDDEIMIQSEEFFKRHFIEFGSSLRLNRGQIIFGVTLQWIQLPFGSAALLTPDVSDHPMGLSVTVSPGFPQEHNGCLTLELFNSSSTAIELKPGQPVGTLSFLPSTKNDIDGESGLSSSTRIRNNRRRPHLDPGYCRQLMQNQFKKL